VLVHSQKPDGAAKGVLLLVHGLEGSSEAGYMRSAARAAREAGFTAHRMNIRGCGGTEGLCNTLYHAGLTTDIRFVARRLFEECGMPVFLAGFSLGANMVLKLAGELGETARGWIAGVVAVSAPLDLLACAMALNAPKNWLYQDRFVRNMIARLRLRHKLMPDLFPLEGIESIRSVYEFDDRVTAPFFGFGNAEGYYGTQSSGLFLDRIRVPTLLIHAKDDPMIPFEVYRKPVLRENPHIELMAADHGGHVGFLAKRSPRFWVDETVREWLGAVNSSRG
jgi:hypothetical protein